MALPLLEDGASWFIAPAPDVLLTEAAVEDVTTDQRGALVQAHAIFDRVRLDALSSAESLELIEELAEQWKPGQ
jgi:hypothetical protein